MCNGNWIPSIHDSHWWQLASYGWWNCFRSGISHIRKCPLHYHKTPWILQSLCKQGGLQDFCHKITNKEYNQRLTGNLPNAPEGKHFFHRIYMMKHKSIPTILCWNQWVWSGIGVESLASKGGNMSVTWKSSRNRLLRLERHLACQFSSQMSHGGAAYYYQLLHKVKAAYRIKRCCQPIRDVINLHFNTRPTQLFHVPTLWKNG